MRVTLTITEAEAGIRTAGWGVADVLDWARRNPEECTLIAGTDVLHVDAVEAEDEGGVLAADAPLQTRTRQLVAAFAGEVKDYAFNDGGDGTAYAEWFAGLLEEWLARGDVDYEEGRVDGKRPRPGV